MTTAFNEPEFPSRWRRVGMAAGILLAALIVAALIHSLVTQSSKPAKRPTQQISLIKPPPPPPPKPELKPPEPPIKKEEVKLEQPKPTPPEPARADEPPPSKGLGVDAEGTGGADGFGLAANKGGASLIDSAPSAPSGGVAIGGPSGASRFLAYATQLQQQLQEALARHEKLRGVAFTAVVRVWLTAEGTIQRLEFSDSSGNDATDSAIRTALADLGPLKQVPPAEMPQPVRLKITSRT
ncbi:MAG: TonB C-terminal domain-containing protein [Burkholderiales bacterium]